MVLGEDYFFFFFAAFFVAKTLTSLRHACLGELRLTPLDSLYQQVIQCFKGIGANLPKTFIALQRGRN